MKVALFGGSFDPIHQGHMHVAKAASKFVDEVWFIPTFVNALNKDLIATYDERVNLISLAISFFRKYRVCTIERELGTVSYTIDCVQALLRYFPTIEFIWIMGADQCNNFKNWKEHQKLTSLIHFYIYPRFEKVKLNANMTLLECDEVDVSSKEIREGIKWSYLSETVRKGIIEQGLYLEKIVKKQMSAKRYEHVISVANLSKKIAMKNGLDSKKAYIGGLLHDISKEMSSQYIETIMRIIYPDLKNEPKPILHAYTGCFYVQKTLGIKDKDILAAIFNHVLGKSSNVYSKIVYISDKLDPLRGNEDSKLVEKYNYNIDMLFKKVHLSQEEYLKKEVSNE